MNKKYSVTTRSLSKGLAYSIFILPFFFGLLQEVLGLPGLVKYIVDAAWLILAVGPVLQGKLRVKREIFPLAVLVVLFVLYTFVVYLFRFQSALYYLWGMRNYLRFYIAFFAFVTYFSEQDAEKCLRFMDKLFVLNFAVCLFQFLQGYEQDYIGGIFGATKGCNGYLVIYLSVVITKSILSYMNGKESSAACFFKSAAALFLAAIAELKFFYVVFIVILGMAYLLTAFSLKKVILLMVSAVMVSAAAAILGSLYSYFEGFLSVESLLNALTQKSYASGSDMGRFTAIPFISNRFLRDLPSQLFGMGLGNCDTGAFGLVNTEFHTRYVDLHYSIFSYAFMFIENGYIGLILYVLFFLLCGVFAWKQTKKETGNTLLCQMSVIGSVVCLGLLVYNSSLRTEAGYMMFFMLALAFMDREKISIS